MQGRVLPLCIFLLSLWQGTAEQPLCPGGRTGASAAFPGLAAMAPQSQACHSPGPSVCILIWVSAFSVVRVFAVVLWMRFQRFLAGEVFILRKEPSQACSAAELWHCWVSRPAQGRSRRAQAEQWLRDKSSLGWQSLGVNYWDSSGLQRLHWGLCIFQ